MNAALPFDGLRVVDLSQGVAGPSAGLMLGLWGCDVVKVEPPSGDWIRGLGKAYPGGHTAGSIAYNRGKRSLALDLRQPGGRAVARRLAADADVVIESNRPGVAARLGLDHAALSADNPKLVTLSVSGYGQQGPYATEPMTDTVGQAFSGLMAINRGPDGVPHRIGTYMVDILTGLYAFQACVMALLQRPLDDGRGRHVDVSLMQGIAAALAPKIAEFALEGGPPPPFNVPAGSYRTKDGWLALTLVTEAQFGHIARALGRPELAADPRFTSFEQRFANERALLDVIEPAIASATTAEWVRRFRAEGAMASAINTPAEWLDDAHVQAVGAAFRVGHAGVGQVPLPLIPGLPEAAQARGRRPAPTVGEHGRAVLEELGLAAAEIDRLAAAGVVALPAAAAGPP